MASVNPPRENIIRALPDIEVRAASDGGPARLSGHFAVFNTPTEIRSAWEGNFIEQIAPGAFKKTLAERGSQMKVLLEHGQDPTVGQKPLGRATTIEEDATGARYDVELYDTPYVNDLLPALRDGQYGASFRFKVMQEDIVESPDPTDWNPRGLPVRTIKEAAVSEFGPVLWGAYPEATAQARSMTDEFLFRRLMDLTPDEKAALADHWRERASDAAIGDTTAPDAEVAITTDTDPVRDAEDVGCLAQALALLSEYAEEDADETVDMDAVKSIASQLAALITAEVSEPEDETNSAPPVGGRTQDLPVEPARTTPTRVVKHSYLTSRKDAPSWKLP